MSVSFFGDLLTSITERGRGLIGLGRGDGVGGGALALKHRAGELLSRRGEASGVALAGAILDRYRVLPREERQVFLRAIAAEFSADPETIAAAIEAYRADPSRASAGALHRAAEPRSQELIRRLNLAQGGTLDLVRMREDLLDLMKDLGARDPAAAEAAEALDEDFAHLFSSWFNRGFLVLRRIDWTTPAHILEKIIRYEAVHAIGGFDELRSRLAPSDRRCFAFFHPALVDEPLIFVEVALTRDIPAAIAPILAESRTAVAPESAATAVFYSISNCQRGLQGVTFGNFLIKQVVEELCRELPGLKTFVTLSPAPGFAAWLDRARSEGAGEIPDDLVVDLAPLGSPGWHEDPGLREALRRPISQAAAIYYLRAKARSGKPLDPVARFHLGNGARLERLNPFGDLSRKGLDQARGLMVNYLYDLSTIEAHHEAYANQREVTASPAVMRLLRALPAARLAAS